MSLTTVMVSPSLTAIPVHSWPRCWRAKSPRYVRWAIGWVAALLARNGVVAVTAAISPYRHVRDEIRRQVEHFVEVFVDTPIDVCESRDVKGLYQRARAGKIPQFTGVSDPYEPPLAPE